MKYENPTIVVYKVNKKNNMLKEEIPFGDFSDPEKRQILYDFFMEGCEKYQGIGISANQLGLRERAFLAQGKMYFNPKILSYSEETIISPEGCLSFPDVKANVKRHQSIEVEYMDINGDMITEELFDMDAIVFQHEYDHITGMTISDRIPSNLLTKKFFKKYKNSKF